MRRSITLGEQVLLMNVFGAMTLPYSDLLVDTNDSNVGGSTNSITPFNVAYMSPSLYASDFSANTVGEDHRAVFLHEMTHVWQFYHSYHKLAQAVWQFIRHKGDYAKAYPYELSYSSKFDDFNMEQQAAIVQDWWRYTHNLNPLYNTSPPMILDYEDQINFIRSSGPPQPEATEADLATAMGNVLANSF